MRQLPAREVRRALLAKGFLLDQRPGRDHDMYILHVNGKKSDFFFKISHGGPDVRRDEIANSARQARVPPSELFKVLCCDYDGRATLALYQGRSSR
jgi:hypothetical protein